MPQTIRFQLGGDSRLIGLASPEIDYVCVTGCVRLFPGIRAGRSSRLWLWADVRGVAGDDDVIRASLLAKLK